MIFVPLSFTSDHIETLFEIETDYMPVIRAEGLQAHRVSAMNRRSDWIEAIAAILEKTPLVENQTLIRS